MEDEHRAFYEPLPNVVEELHQIFKRHKLSQHQAACATACALNQMASVENGLPYYATISLFSALSLKGS